MPSPDGATSVVMPFVYSKFSTSTSRGFRFIRADKGWISAAITSRSLLKDVEGSCEGEAGRNAAFCVVWDTCFCMRPA